MSKWATRLRRLIFGSNEFRRKLVELDKRKAELQLDERFERVAHATLNGDTEWFLTLARKYPECALKIAVECPKALEEKK